jgi:citrate synthase
VATVYDSNEPTVRGYSIHDVAQHAAFEETASLLLDGEWPTATELSGFDARSSVRASVTAGPPRLITSFRQAGPGEWPDWLKSHARDNV